MDWAVYILPFIEQTNTFNQIMVEYNAQTQINYCAAAFLPIPTYSAQPTHERARLGMKDFR